MNEITLYEKFTNPLDAVDQLGIIIAKSGMFGCDNENAGKVLAMICMCERKSPTQIIRDYDIVNGKLRKKALASFGDFRASGGKVKWLKTGEDGIEARAEFTFEGQTIETGFTIEQAKKSEVSFKPGSNWTKTPGNMLRARCLSNAIAMLAPEIFAGGDDSEAEDAPTPEIKLASPDATASPATGKVMEAEVIKSSHSPAKPPSVPPTASPEPTVSPTVSEAVVMPAQSPAPAGQPAAVLLSPEIIAKLEKAIGDHAVIAGKWLLKENWIKPGEGLANLSEARANRILRQTGAFIRAITGSVA